MSRVLTRPRRRGTRLLGLGPLLIVALALGGGVAGCSDAEHSPAASIAVAPSAVAALEPAPDVPLGHMHMPTSAEVEATWEARPGYVRALPGDWQAAYAYALARPDVLQWLPCYCGCGGMGHRSNLDCFFQRREEEGTYTYEEHGSFCNVCVETANLAARLISAGTPIGEIRAIVDRDFGGLAPGTDTPLPPAA